MSSDTTEHEAAPKDDADPPTGLPTESYEAVPLGTTEEDPDGKPHGENEMPGIPTGGEPPSAG